LSRRPSRPCNRPACRLRRRRFRSTARRACKQSVP
jgi:hypothetical protein